MALDPSWNLEHTSQSAISIARGVLQATTTDNVQPLAIAACQQFGNTLAMSRETVRKIERFVVPIPPPAVLAFLKTTIGYCANDCVSYFGGNTAGLRFLGLAVALVTYQDIYTAAEALQAMLSSTAADQSLCPTVRQIRDLLASIEPRCRRVNFSDDVAGWNLLLRRHPAFAELRNPAWEWDRNLAPDKGGLALLVDALRQLHRVGHAHITQVVVRTRKCAGWTIAFVKWSLGCPPSVACDGAASLIIEQPDSQVTVSIPSDAYNDDGNFSVTIYSSICGPSDQVDSVSYPRVTVGMISLRVYGECLLEKLGFSSGLGAKAYQEAIPYALHRATSALSHQVVLQDDHPGTKTVDQTQAHSGELPDQRIAISSSLGSALALSPVRQDSIARIHKLLFCQELGTVMKGDDLDIADLPDVVSYARECCCIQCAAEQAQAQYNVCRSDKFFSGISEIVADVLALSLVEFPDLLQVSRASGLENALNSSLQGLPRIIGKAKNEHLQAWDILQRAMQMLGHDVKRLNANEWVISSAKGQAVWPTIYETRSYDRQGYLSLSWHPGLLKHKGETYDLAHSAQSSVTTSDPITGICRDEVSRPSNLCPKLIQDWMVSADQHGLKTTLGVRYSDKNTYHSIGLRPAAIFKSLSRALLVQDCTHDPNANVEYLYPEVKFTGPFSAHDPSASISVVAVDGDIGLRFVSLVCLEGDSSVVLRKQACLSCCLRLCRRAGCQVLVL